MGFVGGCWGFFELFFPVVVENCDALGLLGFFPIYFCLASWLNSHPDRKEENQQGVVYQSYILSHVSERLLMRNLEEK